MTSRKQKNQYLKIQSREGEVETVHMGVGETEPEIGVPAKGSSIRGISRQYKQKRTVRFARRESEDSDLRLQQNTAKKQKKHLQQIMPKATTATAFTQTMVSGKDNEQDSSCNKAADRTKSTSQAKGQPQSTEPAVPTASGV